MKSIMYHSPQTVVVCHQCGFSSSERSNASPLSASSALCSTRGKCFFNQGNTAGLFLHWAHKQVLIHNLAKCHSNCAQRQRSASPSQLLLQPQVPLPTVKSTTVFPRNPLGISAQSEMLANDHCKGNMSQTLRIGSLS